MSARHLPAGFIFVVALAALAVPAAAQQQSESYKFLQAVKDSKNEDVLRMIDKPGSSIINTHDYSSGEGALHIVVKRGDNVYLQYLLQKGADPNLRDNSGTTAMLLAVTLGQPGLIDTLIAAKANPNLGNSRGETPLIRAVQRRDIGMIRQLLAAGADPDQADVIAGRSARDYAHQDTRTPVLAKLIDDTPKKASRAVSGPKL